MGPACPRSGQRCRRIRAYVAPASARPLSAMAGAAHVGSSPCSRVPRAAWWLCDDSTDPCDWWDSTDPSLWKEKPDQRLIDEPIENIDAKEPTLPSDATDP